jgi:hypothetical protein
MISIITANNPRAYKALKNIALLPGEVLGSAPVRLGASWISWLGNFAKRGSKYIHAEQLGVNDAVAAGYLRGIIATSWRGCQRECVPLLEEFFKGFRHVNPQPAREAARAAARAL